MSDDTVPILERYVLRCRPLASRHASLAENIVDTPYLTLDLDKHRHPDHGVSGHNPFMYCTIHLFFFERKAPSIDL